MLIVTVILALAVVVLAAALAYFMRRNRVVFKEFPADTAAILEQTVSRLDAQYAQLHTLEQQREQSQQAYAYDLHSQWQTLLQNLHASTQAWENDLAQSDNERDERYNRFVKAIAQAHRDLETKQTNMVQQVTELSEFTGEYRQSYRRFQDGYDFKILKSFLAGLLRIIDDSSHRLNDDAKYVNESGHSDTGIQFARGLLRDLTIFLENHGVETYAAQDGETYAGNERLYKVAYTEAAPYAEMGGTIKTTLTPGYCYTEGDAPKVLQPASIVLYRDAANANTDTATNVAANTQTNNPASTGANPTTTPL